MISSFFIFDLNKIFAQVVNLLQNGDFANNFTEWQAGSGASIITSDIRSGVKTAHLTGVKSAAQIVQNINAKANTQYKVTMWIKINPATNCPAGSECWGGFRPKLDNWSGTTPADVGTLDLLTPSTRTVGVWFKESFNFTTGTQANGQINISPYSGAGWNWDVLVDDVKLFQVSTVNTLPTISITSGTLSASTIPATISFISAGDDPDGSINYYFWDFGDGGHSNNANDSHTYISNGTFVAKLIVYDDSGGFSSDSKNITINDPIYPSISLDNFPSVITSPTLTINGTASAGNGTSISKVTWSTDRGLAGTATGTSSWNFTTDLTNYGGVNKFMVNITSANGKIARKDFDITYNPTSKVNIINGASGVVANSTNVEIYDKFEATFNIQDTTASNLNIPYATNLPGNMGNGTGISIDGIFTSPSGKNYTQPGFIYQNFTRNTTTKQLLAIGNPVWKMRFSAQELGSWTYKILLKDGSGNTVVTDNTKLKFNVVPATNKNNHGFLSASNLDTRYFQFSDGTPYIGVGPGPVLNTSFDTDNSIANVGNDNSNLSRTWMSGDNVAGSSWAPWTGKFGYTGNFPSASLTTDEAYRNHVYSMALPSKESGQQCTFYQRQGVNASLKQNTNYRVLVRVKTVGVTGTGGFTVRPAPTPINGNGYPDTCNKFAAQPLTIPYIIGNTDWLTVTGTWNSGNNQFVGYTMLTMENVTAGKVYLDEVSIREDLGNGNFGPEVMPRSSFNSVDQFSQEPSWNWDYGLDEFAKRGEYEKIVITEKEDFSYNHISPYGYGYAPGNRMQIVGGASQKYQEFYWRYLIARYGYSRAVHSFEYVNEDYLGNLSLADQMAKYFDSNDPSKQMTTTSFVCCYLNAGQSVWSTSLGLFQDYADTHSYVNVGGPVNSQSTTSWLGTTDPMTGINMTTDSAIFAPAHSIDALKNNAGNNKPIIMGEAGIINGANTLGDTDSDSKGVWLHQFIWSQMNSGGMYFIYWYDNNIVKYNLYPQFGIYRKFLEGQSSDIVNKKIPLNNGKFKDIIMTLPTGILGWGQKDVTNGAAQFWIYDKNYTWQNQNAGNSMGGKQVTFDGLPARTYTVEYWDTNTGNVLGTEMRNHTGGVMSLTIPSSVTNKDVGVKIFPQSGYAGVTGIPTPTVNPCPAKPTGDANCDGIINIIDFEIWRKESTNVSSFKLSDFNLDSAVDTQDYIIWKNNNK